MFDVFFINLDAREDRRRFVEGNFSEVNRQGWRLTRIPAVSAEQISSQQLGPGISPGEAGCFLSHRSALDQAVSRPGHVLIAEDDVLFGPRSQDAIKAAVDGMGEGDWDIMFTDIGIPHADGMIDLFRDRSELARRQEFTLVDLKNRSFHGSTAYLINHASKAKLLSLISEQADPVRFPYDLFLRLHIQAGLIKAYVIFPFGTTISHFSDQSQIQNSGNTADVLWNSFRRLMWMDRDIEAAMKAVRAADWPVVDPQESRAMQELLSVMLSPRLALR